MSLKVTYQGRQVVIHAQEITVRDGAWTSPQWWETYDECEHCGQFRTRPRVFESLDEVMEAGLAEYDDERGV